MSRESGPDFSMFTPKGDAAVEAMCDDIIAQIRAGELRRTDLPKAVNEGCKKVARTPRKPGEKTSWGKSPSMKTYGEVHDTEPQVAIADYISAECEKQGWLPLSRWDW